MSAYDIVAVESRGGTIVRTRFRDGVVADHDMSYLVGRSGVFAALTAEMIAAVHLVDGDTIGWQLPDGQLIDLAPDALHEHAVTGRCPGGSCEGWTPAHTGLIDVVITAPWTESQRDRECGEQRGGEK
ncbi:hypothetical protein A5722_14930 [Mycobacterium vulneris]|nr:hypothetical protein A5722_14930 [Mycolicibacterium vulneris]OCB66217.1 hypothetical protein A5729_12435 [Mycolicibacterium vulneris]